MKKLTILALALIVSVAGYSQSTYKLDKSHSKMTFTVTHLMMSEVDGVFKSFDASVKSSKEDFSDAVFELTADMRAVSTNNDMRDGHLQKDDMFGAEKFPTLTFKSTGIKKIDAKKFTLSGNLTMKGVTKPVTLDLVLLGTGKNQRSQKPMVGFKASGKIRRTDFGVGGMPDAMVSDEVELRASGEFVQE